MKTRHILPPVIGLKVLGIGRTGRQVIPSGAAVSLSDCTKVLDLPRSGCPCCQRRARVAILMTQ